MFLEINYSELDPGCVPIVKYFNEHGLPTKFSCQGHNKPGCRLFYVIFDSCVTEKDIILFQKRHVDYLGNVVKCGRFYQEVIYFPKAEAEMQVRHLWKYVAANVEESYVDLEHWEYIDKLKSMLGVFEAE